MSRSRSASGNVQAGSLDSFLDIVTNSLGVLILVATLSVLGTQNLKISLGTPIMTDAEETLAIHTFEVRDGRIVPVDSDFIAAEIVEFLNAEEGDLQRLADRFNAGNHTNGYHRFEFRVEQIGILTVPMVVFLPAGGDVGTPIADVEAEGTEFAKQLRSLDSKKDWLYFIVRSDSFESFRKVRQKLKERGFRVGWSPIDVTEELKSSRYGSPAQIDE